MTKGASIVLGVALAGSLLATACGAASGSPRKIVVNENVCAGGVRLLRLKLGEPNRIVLDNKQHSENQDGLTLTLTRFPVFVHGDVPEGSTIGSPLSTIQISADAGEESTVDVEPTFTGTYTGNCQVSIHEATGGRRSILTDVTFELVES